MRCHVHRLPCRVLLCHDLFLYDHDVSLLGLFVFGFWQVHWMRICSYRFAFKSACPVPTFQGSPGQCLVWGFDLAYNSKGHMAGKTRNRKNRDNRRSRRLGVKSHPHLGNWERSGIEAGLSRPAPSGPLLQIRIYPVKVSQPSQTAPATRSQLLKHASLWVTFHNHSGLIAGSLGPHHRRPSATHLQTSTRSVTWRIYRLAGLKRPVGTLIVYTWKLVMRGACQL